VSQTTNNPPKKTDMQNKRDKRKKTKKQVKVQDLKPVKDAKGGGGHQIQHGPGPG